MFLYYIPGRTQGPEMPEQMLQCQFDGRDPVVRAVLGGGPDAGQGAIVCDKAVGSSAGYFPERQTWTQINERLWIGYENDSPPTPEGLARAKQIDGHHVRVGSHSWLVPIARRWTFETGAPLWYDSLPKKLTYLNGAWQYGETIERCARLWKIAERWMDETQYAASGEDNPERPVLTLLEAAELAVEALSFNYRVWHEEMSMIGVLDGSVVRDVLNAVIDLPTYREWVEKKSEQHAG